MRLIDADELLKQRPFTISGGTLSDYTEGYLDAIEDAVNCIKNFSTADIAEVKHGKWIEYPVAHYFKCSECKYTVPYKKACLFNGHRAYNWCPHCGARMDYET